MNRRKTSYLGLGIPYAGGTVALLLPAEMLRAYVEGEAGTAISPRDALAGGAGLAVLIAALGGVLFTLLLMRLRAFPWRALRYRASFVAAVLGAAWAAVALACRLIPDGAMAEVIVLAAGVFVSPFAFKRVAF